MQPSEVAADGDIVVVVRGEVVLGFEVVFVIVVSCGDVGEVPHGVVAVPLEVEGVVVVELVFEAGEEPCDLGGGGLPGEEADGFAVAEACGRVGDAESDEGVVVDFVFEFGIEFPTMEEVAGFEGVKADEGVQVGECGVHAACACGVGGFGVFIAGGDAP